MTYPVTHYSIAKRENSVHRCTTLLLYWLQ